MWRAINIFLPQLERSNIVEDKTTDNKNIKLGQESKITTPNQPTKASRSGQKRGVQNFTEKELSVMLDLIEEIKPCGAHQWDLVSTNMYDKGFKNRDREACKKKFDRLWQMSKPTGCTEMPIDVKRAKEIKDLISNQEAIGYSSHNSDDSPGGLVGTNLVGKDGEMKHPTTQKRKKAKIIDMLDDTCESIIASNNDVNLSLQKIANAIEFDNGSSNDEVKKNYDKLEKNFNEFKAEVKSQFNNLNSTLTALLSKFD